MDKEPVESSSEETVEPKVPLFDRGGLLFIVGIISIALAAGLILH